MQAFTPMNTLFNNHTSTRTAFYPTPPTSCRPRTGYADALAQNPICPAQARYAQTKHAVMHRIDACQNFC